MRVKIHGNVHFWCDQPGTLWTAESDQITNILSVSGETLPDLLEAIRDTLDVMLLDFRRTGDLDRYLADHNLTVDPDVDIAAADGFDLPFTHSVVNRVDSAPALAG